MLLVKRDDGGTRCIRGAIPALKLRLNESMALKWISPGGHIRGVLKSKSSSATSFSTSFAERRLSVLGAMRVTMRLHGPEQETETPQFTVKVAALLVTVPALLLTTTSNVAPLSELVVAGVTWPAEVTPEL